MSSQEQDTSLDVIGGMIKLFAFDVYALLNPEVGLSFITPCFAMNFDIIPKKLSKPFSLSTPVCESIQAERV